jgi:periplasmic protein CpxP/Spy
LRRFSQYGHGKGIRRVPPANLISTFREINEKHSPETIQPKTENCKPKTADCGPRTADFPELIFNSTLNHLQPAYILSIPNQKLTNMKTLMMSVKALMLAVLVVSGTQTFAQKKADKRHEINKEKREQHFAEASKRLNLTADQQTKIRAIVEQNKEESKALFKANKDKSKDEKRKVMVEQRRKFDSKIIAVLDEKQKAIYGQMKEEKKAKMQEKKAERQKAEDELGDAGISIF